MGTKVPRPTCVVSELTWHHHVSLKMGWYLVHPLAGWHSGAPCGRSASKLWGLFLHFFEDFWGFKGSNEGHTQLVRLSLILSHKSLTCKAIFKEWDFGWPGVCFVFEAYIPFLTDVNVTTNQAEKCKRCIYFHMLHCRSIPHVPRRPCLTNLWYPINPSKKGTSMIMEMLSRKKLVGQTLNMFENIHMWQ